MEMQPHPLLSLSGGRNWPAAYRPLSALEAVAIGERRPPGTLVVNGSVLGAAVRNDHQRHSPLEPCRGVEVAAKVFLNLV
jgi:hypothetical protein